MADQQESSKKNKSFVLIGLIVVLGLGLVIYFVTSGGSSDTEQTPAQANQAPAEPGATNPEDNQAAAPEGNETDGGDTILAEAQLILDDFRLASQSFEAVVESCDETLASAEKEAITGILDRLATLAGKVESPTPEQSKVLARIDAHLEVHDQLEISALTSCPSLAPILIQANE